MHKSFYKGLSIVLAAGVLAGSVCAVGYASRNSQGEWFKDSHLSWYKDGITNSGDNSNNQKEPTSVTAANMIVQQQEMDGIRLLSAPMPLAAYAAYEISPQADSVQLLTATLEPADATYQQVDYTVAWRNANSAWASGKDITEYITISQSTDGALQCAVSVLKPIGEEAIITCTARPLEVGAWAPSATCTVNYFKRINSIKSLVYKGENIYVDDEGESQTDYYTSQNFVIDPVITYSNDTNYDWVQFQVDFNYTEGTKTRVYNYDYELTASPYLISQIEDYWGVNLSGDCVSVDKPEWRSAIDDLLYDTFTYAGASRNEMYNIFSSVYSSGNAAFVLCVFANDTTDSTHSTYFDVNLKFNPVSYAVATTKVTLDKDNLDF
ncbi:MAG: hypothetical protein NC131_00365 [Roseburia sp.]|nr:hypothetical protein [Roseburia sp.]